MLRQPVVHPFGQVLEQLEIADACNGGEYAGSHKAAAEASDDIKHCAGKCPQRAVKHHPIGVDHRHIERGKLADEDGDDGKSQTFADGAPQTIFGGLPPFIVKKNGRARLLSCL